MPRIFLPIVNFQLCYVLESVPEIHILLSPGFTRENYAAFTVWLEGTITYTIIISPVPTVDKKTRTILMFFLFHPSFVLFPLVVYLGKHNLMMMRSSVLSDDVDF